VRWPVFEKKHMLATVTGWWLMEGILQSCESASLIFQFLKNKHRGKIAQTACNQAWHQHGW
jgi:hypothetical protein